ncbi:MAG TPA: Asp-tRNA(Asn)/Glu-tRNA(Gln) amidotransferase subunit GatA [candidate division Zixibacteria bacterium]|nr:Asp-tRNA(Asn)/Glu-tRNA(Gln) amidotransferase subunit GatA [candidate division Zixibacteria bacterium]HER00623.1 Asp-tRNA(Asn)/Glu-tRNA(Gln) amidotransferase subunit GatA [candidate division Zixibacteria bacterium]
MEFESMSAAQIRASIIKGEFTASDIAEYFLKQAKAENSRLNCIISFGDSYAARAAENISQKIAAGLAPGKLAGVPIVIKDNLITKDLRTTCASHILEDFIPPYNATVIESLLKQDAIIIGKANMDEFGMGSSNEHSYFGRVPNPIDPEYVPGGSSGGSACAVASGLAPLALGSDTGGSVRQPASFCGIVGLKPSYGAVSRYGLVAFGSSFDQIGPMARTVEDCAILFSVICKHDPRDSTSANYVRPDYLEALKGRKKFSIGIPREYMAEGIDGEVLKAVQDAIEKAEGQGHEITEISLPHTKQSIAAYYTIANSEASSNLSRFDGVRYGYRSTAIDDLAEMYIRTRSAGFGAEVKRRIMLGTYSLSTGYYDEYYLKAAKVREIIRDDFDKAFNEVDLIITPTSPTTAFKLGEKIDNPLGMYLSDIYTVSASLAGLPAISIPCGKDNKGLPIGLQIIGKMFREDEILNLAYNLEREIGYNLKQ